MRRIGTIPAVLALAMTLAGCWLQPGFDAGQSRWNGGETALTRANVGGLTELWDTAIPTAQFVREPVSTGGAVYAATASGDVAALDATTGALRWSRSFDFADGGWPTFEAPTSHDGELLVPAFVPTDAGLPGGDLLRLDPADGSTLGGDGFDGPAFQTVAVADGVPAVMSGKVDPVGVVDVDWKFRVTNVVSLLVPSRSIAIAGDHILWTWGSAAQGYGPSCSPWPPDFPAPDPGCRPDWATGLSGTLLSPAAIGTEQVVYVGNGGEVAVLDVATGAVLWTASLGAAVAHPPVVVGGGPAPGPADGVVLVATTDGRLVALPAAGCDAATCAPLWSAEVGGVPSSPPAAGGDVAYVGTSTGDVVAFAVDGCGGPTCGPLARVDAGASIRGGPVVDGGRVVVGTDDGRVVAFGLP